MDHFAGLDVSVKETSVCVVDDTGRIVREVKVARPTCGSFLILNQLSPDSTPWPGLFFVFRWHWRTVL
jgi:hypothetical protein